MENIVQKKKAEGKAQFIEFIKEHAWILDHKFATAEVQAVFIQKFDSSYICWYRNVGTYLPGLRTAQNKANMENCPFTTRTDMLYNIAAYYTITEPEAAGNYIKQAKCIETKVQNETFKEAQKDFKVRRHFCLYNNI